MNRDDIIRMAREACGEPAWDGGVEWTWEEVERFANLVAAAERERIIAANAPEIEKVNVYIKALEDAVAAERARLAQPEPYAAQAAMVAQQTQGRMYVDPVTGDVGIGTVKWDASAPLVMHPHPAFKKPWVGLTDEEIIACIQRGKSDDLGDYVKPLATSRAVEAKLKEKNT